MTDENRSDEQDDKHKNPVDKLAAVELPQVAVGPGVTPLVGPVGSLAPIPAATPQKFICLRGPCRHYWEFETHIDSGNPQETWDPEIGLKDADGNPIRQPQQQNRVCLVHPGTETELDDTNVYTCSRWSPLTPREVRKLEKLRKAHYRRNPTHDPSFVPANRLTR